MRFISSPFIQLYFEPGSYKNTIDQSPNNQYLKKREIIHIKTPFSHEIIYNNHQVVINVDGWKSDKQFKMDTYFIYNLKTDIFYFLSTTKVTRRSVLYDMFIF